MSHSDLRGGAARAAYRQHRALVDADVDSTLLVREKQSDDDSVREVPHSDSEVVRRLRARVERDVARLQQTPNPNPHSANVLPTKMAHLLDADIVNLHWIGSGAMSSGDIARVLPPVVMTLHDMWAFSGAEHYGPDGPDARWTSAYERDNRPPGHKGLDVDRYVWHRKRKWTSRATIVSPSRWLDDCVARSELLGDRPRHLIPYAIDLETFRPSRPSSRLVPGVPEGSSVILFAAIGGSSDPRKGFDLLEAALRRINRESTVCVVMGQEEPALPPDVGLPLLWTGHLDEDQQLVELYNSADVVVVPSRQDNLPQTATEAQSCGTPVVAFRVGGLPDAVVHDRTGYLAEPFDTSDLAAGIDWVLDDEERRAHLGRAARARAVSLWEPSRIAGQYIDVYAEVIERRRSSPPS